MQKIYALSAGCFFYLNGLKKLMKFKHYKDNDIIYRTAYFSGILFFTVPDYVICFYDWMGRVLEVRLSPLSLAVVNKAKHLNFHSNFFFFFFFFFFFDEMKKKKTFT